MNKMRTKLVDLLDHNHPLFILSNKINWNDLKKEAEEFFCDGIGRPPIPVRLLAGLHYLKYIENKSDEDVVRQFIQNPYWQYFCGYTYFEHEFPLHPTTLVKWRKKVGVTGVENLLKETLRLTLQEKFLKKSELNHMTFDTTVQEKNIAFPTDVSLFHKLRRILIKLAKKYGIKLRQSYERVGQRAFIRCLRYKHARQMKRAKSEQRKVKVFLGRVIRDLERKCHSGHTKLKALLEIGKRLINQKKKDKNKLYSIHAPEVECISKGKTSKKYEFGCKVALATTTKTNWIVGADALHGNPYDGHTLRTSIDQVERLSGQRPKEAYVDRGYKGSKCNPDDVHVNIAGSKRTAPTAKRFIKRRAAIEPIIGHLKSDHRMGRNFLAGKLGDRINSILSAAAFNLNKILNLLVPCRT